MFGISNYIYFEMREEIVVSGLLLNEMRIMETPGQ
jgi:hypothetical protein